MQSINEVVTKFNDAAQQPGNDHLRAEVSDLMKGYGMLESGAARSVLTHALEKTGVLPQLLVSEMKNIDADGDDYLSQDELQKTIDGKGTSPLTALAAEHALKSFEQIDESDDDAVFSLISDGSTLSKDELAAFAAAEQERTKDARMDMFMREGRLTAPAFKTEPEMKTEAWIGSEHAATAGMVGKTESVTTATEEAKAQQKETEKLLEKKDGTIPNDPSNLLVILKSTTSSAEQKLNAVMQLGEQGIKNIAFSDADGKELQCRIALEQVAPGSSKYYVHLFAKDDTGKERIALRAIFDQGKLLNERNAQGEEVGFVGDWWSKSRPQSAFKA